MVETCRISYYHCITEIHAVIVKEITVKGAVIIRLPFLFYFFSCFLFSLTTDGTSNSAVAHS